MWFLEYLRLVAYALVFMVSVIKLWKHPDRKLSIIGDVLISGGLLFSVVHFLWFGVDKEVARGIILTPITILWSIIIYINFLKK